MTTMMSAAEKPASLSDTQQIQRDSGKLIERKIWLPKMLYDAVPYFYFVAGIAAFFATLYINQWFWVLPHYVLFSAFCIHFGIVIYRRRRRTHIVSADADGDRTAG